MLNQRGNLSVILGIVLLVTVVGAGSYYLSSLKKSDQTPINTTPSSTIIQNISTEESSLRASIDEESTWKTYINSKYHYSIDYPSEMVISEDKKYPENVSFGNQMTITVSDIKKPVCQGDCRADERINKVENKKIGDLQVVKSSGELTASHIAGYSPPQSFIKYEFEKNNHFFTVVITELALSDLSYENEEKYPSDRKVMDIPTDKLELFDKMVTTFKFID